MARRHVGLGLSGLFIVFMTILLVLPYVRLISISGFVDMIVGPVTSITPAEAKAAEKAAKAAKAAADKAAKKAAKAAENAAKKAAKKQPETNF